MFYSIRKIKWTLSEFLFIGAGLLFLISTVWIASGGNFSVLLAAKIIYLVGVVLLLLNK
jgi:hypothetical protein